MGPLKGFKIIEIAGVGPGQQAGMLLADMGASVVRIDRPGQVDLGFNLEPRFDILNRSRPIVGVDLKSAEGAQLVLDLCSDADAIFEGFRPGVMERLGLGPQDCLACNPALVYGRMTGYGQDGPLADAVGHDPNYIALAGVYGCVGEKGGDPVYPLNLAGDMGGGAAYLVIGMLAALLEAQKSGKGQVVDAAMIDGAASQMAMIWGLRAAGKWNDQRGSNLLDGGAPFAATYRTSDDRHVVIAPVETRFFQNLLDELEIDDIDPATRNDPAQWDAIRQRLQSVIETKTRDEWSDILEGTDTCFCAILDLQEASEHPHNLARKTFVDLAGIRQPAPAPRFSRTPASIKSPAAGASEDIENVLEAWGASATAMETAKGLSKS